MVAVRAKALVFIVKMQLTVPELPLQPPDVIESQLPPDVTMAAQGMIPVTVFDTLTVVEPASLATSWLTGLTEITECSNALDCPPRTART